MSDDWSITMAVDDSGIHAGEGGAGSRVARLLPGMLCRLGESEGMEYDE